MTPLQGIALGLSLFASWTLVGTQPAFAGEQDPLLELQWTAPESCASQREIEVQVANLLGGPTDGASHVEAKVVAWKGEDALWHVQIRTLTGTVHGERKVDGESCKAVSDASALILAMAIDPEAVAAKTMSAPPTWDPTDRPAPLPVVSVRPSGTRPAPPLPVVSVASGVAPDVPTRGSLGLTGGVDVGTLPSPAPWFGGLVSVGRGNTRLELDVAFLSEQTQRIEQNEEAGGTFDLATVGAAGCYNVVGDGPSLAVCGGVNVGVMNARGFGVTDPGKADPIWISLSPKLVGTWPVFSRLSLRIEVGAAVPLRRPGFDLNPYGQVHRASAVVGRAAFGPQFHFE